MTNCEKCGALMIESKNKPGKWYCSALCWKKDEKPSQNGYIPKNDNIARHDIVVTRTEKPHSFEFGPANKRLKIYFSDVPDLINQLRILENAGLIMEADYKYQAPIEKPNEPTF